MSRRGRKRKLGPREPSGRGARAREAPYFNFWQARKRTEFLNPSLAEKALNLAKLTLEEQGSVIGALRDASKNFLLSHLTGRAFAQHLFRWKDDRGEEHDGAELMQAADIHAALHRAVWGKLPSDIEASVIKRYGYDAFTILLEVGRIRAPAPPGSHFRNLVAETPSPPGEPDPAEYLKQRLRLADRYGASRAVLYGSQGEHQHRGAVVENIVVWGIEPAFLRAGELATARTVGERTAFESGLRALAYHYDLFDRRGDRPAGKRE